ncbi:integrase catalytic domain-containing protein [Trichonephila clavipes]|nr:integrase catalytic domain-containing protein [Trichonephila clavipes]
MARGIARKTVHDCIACFRQKPTGVDQLMGNLPSERVTPSAPFLNSGVDFCGPFQIKFKNQRKGIFSKVYVAIFVCLATKAIHLEAVTDLTTEAFIAALKRLCARRGRISTLMSDNATNFKGAAAELNRFIKLICNKNETLANYFASEAIQWKFIPPRSPNFGGLWEAGVKSFKHHLYRTLVNSKITFEEFETIIIQIEGILNSRPLVPLSDNINEYEVLTPGHFIIGRPISAIPEPAILDISDNRLSRWQYTTKCVQTLWKRWKNDYLNHLQQRNKWQFEKNNVAVGCLVLLKENDLPPCKWAMARILEVIYGTDDWFQQDGAACHTARATIDLLKDTFGDRIIARFGPVNWPPRSCDLTPLDYFLWGYVKSLVYADKPQTLDHLEDNIRRVIADIRPQMLEKVIENWTSRLDYIRASRGSPMPEIIFKM